MDVDGGFGRLPVTSDLPRTSDIVRSPLHVSKVPEADLPCLVSLLPPRFFAGNRGAGAEPTLLTDTSSPLSASWRSTLPPVV